MPYYDRLRPRRPAPVSLADVRTRARRTLPRILFDFIDGGAGDEFTQRQNRDAFHRWRLDPRMAVAVGHPDLGTAVLGQRVDLPVLLAPCGGLSLVHPDGTGGALRAARSAGTIGAVSALSGDLLENVIAAGGAGHWFQLYKIGGTDAAKVLVERAQTVGYRTLVVTVDSPIVGHKERDVRNGGIRPGGVSISKVDFDTVRTMAPKVIGKPRWLLRFLRSGLPLGHPNLDRLSAVGGPVDTELALAQWRAEPLVWGDFSWLRERWPGPIVVKGVLSAADARRCVDVGADGIVVSNHGGRQLDGVPATIDVLAGVAEAVDGRADVLLDGGVRRGTDVITALALGAKAVLIGRPYLYGLADGGEAGVRLVLELLRAEIERAMILLGCRSVTDLDRTWLTTVGDTAANGSRASGSAGAGAARETAY